MKVDSAIGPKDLSQPYFQFMQLIVALLNYGKRNVLEIRNITSCTLKSFIRYIYPPLHCHINPV